MLAGHVRVGCMWLTGRAYYPYDGRKSKNGKTCEGFVTFFTNRYRFRVKKLLIIKLDFVIENKNMSPCQNTTSTCNYTHVTHLQIPYSNIFVSEKSI